MTQAPVVVPPKDTAPPGHTEPRGVNPLIYQAGELVFYSGSRLLAPDLSLPVLQRRWRDGPVAVRRGSPWVAATRSVQRARVRLRQPGTGGQGEDPAGIAYGVGDVVVAVAGLDGAPRWWSETAELVERAGRVGQAQVEYGPVSLDLRRAARGLLAHRRVGSGDDPAGMLTLAVALAALLVEIGRWRKAQHRPHQAAAAHAAASMLAGHERRARERDRQLALDLVASTRGPVNATRITPAAPAAAR